MTTGKQDCTKGKLLKTRKKNHVLWADRGSLSGRASGTSRYAIVKKLIKKNPCCEERTNLSGGQKKKNGGGMGQPGHATTRSSAKAQLVKVNQKGPQGEMASARKVPKRKGREGVKGWEGHMELNVYHKI